VNPTADSATANSTAFDIHTHQIPMHHTAHHRDQEAPWPRSARRRRGELVMVCDAKCPDNNGGAVGEGGIRSIGSIGPGRRCDETQMQIMVRYGHQYLSSKFYRTAAQCASRSHTNEGKARESVADNSTESAGMLHPGLPISHCRGLRFPGPAAPAAEE
jgi:hypothetical protein